MAIKFKLGVADWNMICVICVFWGMKKWGKMNNWDKNWGKCAV